MRGVWWDVGCSVVYCSIGVGKDDDGGGGGSGVSYKWEVNCSTGQVSRYLPGYIGLFIIFTLA